MKQSILLIFYLLICLSSFGQSDESNATFKQGVELYHQHKYKDAISKFKRCKELDDLEMDSLDFRKEYTKEWIAHCYYKLLDIEKAKAQGTQDYDIVPIDRTQIAESDSVISLAHTIASNGNIVYAITKLKEGLKLEEKMLGSNHYAVANTHSMLAIMYVGHNDLDSAEKELQQSKQIYCHNNLSESYAYGIILLREAYLNFRKGAQQEYIRLAKESLERFVKWDNARYKELIDVYYLLTVGESTPVPSQKSEEYIILLAKQLEQIQENEVYGYAEQIVTCCQGLLFFQHTDEAINLLNKSLNYIQHRALPNGNNRFYTSLLVLRSNIFKTINRLDEALNDAKQVVSICENTMLFDKSQLDELYVLIADIYHSKNEPLLQLQAAKEAYRMASERADDRRLCKATAKSFMAGANYLLENKKDAVNDIKETMTLYEQLNLSETGYYASGLSLKAEIEQSSNPQMAIEDCKRSASIYLKQTPIQYDRLVYVKLLLFQLYKKQSLNEEANNTLKEIEDIADIPTITKDTKERILITLYNAKGNMESIDNPDVALNYFREAKKLAMQNDGNDISIYDIGIAMCLARSSRLVEATLLVDSLIVTLSTQTGKRLQYANALGTASFIYGSRGDVANMKRFQNEALQLCKEIYGGESVNYAVFLTSIAYQLMQLGLAMEAHPLCKEAEKKMLVHFAEGDGEMIPLYTCLQTVELSLGNVDKAVKYGEKAKAIAKEFNLQMVLCEVLCNLSNCYREKSQFNEAMNLLNEAMSIAEKNEGQINMRCAQIFLQLATVCQAMGNYSDARTYNSCYYEIAKRKADKTQPQYALALMYEANLEYEKGEYEKAKTIASEAIDILNSTLGENNTMTLEAKGTIAQLLIQQGNISEAILKLEDIHKIQKKHNRIYDLSILNQLAFAYGLNNQYKKQIYIAEKILDVIRYKYGKESQQEGNVYLHFANAYLGLGNTKKGAYYSSKAFEITQKTILDNFLFMTKKERTNLWNSVSTFFLVTLPTTCASVDNHSDFSEVTYNAALLSKGLLLQAETNISEIIYNSGKDILKSEYNLFLNTRTIYNNATAAYNPNEELDDGGKVIAVIDSLKEELDSQEHALMKHVNAELGNYTSNLATTWKDVQQTLNESDIAIEFLCATWNTDSVLYYALVVTKEDKSPVYIALVNGVDMSAYHNFKDLNEFKMKELSSFLWEPILSRYPNKRNIYFSPCGDLFNIPIESLPSYDSDTFLSDKYKFYRLSSTRELSGAYNKWEHNSISLYGDVKYDASVDDMTKDFEQYKDRRSHSSQFFEFTADESMRGGIVLSPLPGTAEEVSSIVSLINATDSLSMSVSPHIGLEASEASVKSMSGLGNRVLHIATHGFYYPENKISSSRYLQSVLSIEDKGGVSTYESAEDAALLRCGLYLAGAKNRLRGDKVSGVDDGILTAREISMLNLSGLDLAVLSACETGIGDVTGDGVFGLQRGFKKAGTHSILMSLWKVDDDATSYLMREFYRCWLSGTDKQLALEYAKQQVRMRSGWASPKFWAAFVLLDGIGNN